MEPGATLVDSNVIIDLLGRDPVWGGWSRAQVASCATAGGVLINQHIYAEIAPFFESAAELDEAVSAFLRVNFPWPAAYLAGQAFKRYRRLGGTRSSVLPDFYIGAHAEVAGLRLLTRDATRYRSYFPTIDLITP